MVEFEADWRGHRGQAPSATNSRYRTATGGPSLVGVPVEVGIGTRGGRLPRHIPCDPPVEQVGYLPRWPRRVSYLLHEDGRFSSPQWGLQYNDRLESRGGRGEV